MNDLFATAGSFDEFWQRYPRKIGKGAARKSYDKALKLARHDDIMFSLSQQLPAMEAKDVKFIPHASTWLNQERWEDDPERPNYDPSDPDANPTARAIAFAGQARRTPSKHSF